MNNNYLVLEANCLPSFTYSTSLTPPALEPDWRKAAEIITLLHENGIELSSPTLFNMEKRGELHPHRHSARKTMFDWNEVKERFNL